jgi:hypothetical protein
MREGGEKISMGLEKVRGFGGAYGGAGNVLPEDRFCGLREGVKQKRERRGAVTKREESGYEEEIVGAPVVEGFLWRRHRELTDEGWRLGSVTTNTYMRLCCPAARTDTLILSAFTLPPPLRNPGVDLAEAVPFPGRELWGHPRTETSRRR